MTILTIAVGVLELAALAIVTGCLVALAALSHVVEWLFVIVNPTINFFLHQVNELILEILKNAKLGSWILFRIQGFVANDMKNFWRVDRVIGKSENVKEAEVLLADLCTKAPFLQSVLRPEYTSYLNTAGTVILGWIVVAWISHLIWSLIVPLTISLLAVVMVCPTTLKWLLRQVSPNQELAVSKFIESFQAVVPDF